MRVKLLLVLIVLAGLLSFQRALAQDLGSTAMGETGY